MEAVFKGGDIRLFIHLPVFEFNYGLKCAYPLPLVTSKKDAVAHYYDVLSPYLGVSHDRQLFMKLSVDGARRCAPFLGSVCPFLKPIDRKAKTSSCTAAVFLQDKMSFNVTVDSTFGNRMASTCFTSGAGDGATKAYCNTKVTRR